MQGISNTERTAEIVEYIKANTGESLTDKTNKKIKNLLSKMGITTSSVRVKGVAGGWVTSYSHDEEIYNINTARESLRNILNGIKHVGFLNHQYIQKMEAGKDEIYSILGDYRDVDSLFDYDNIDTIRASLKRLYRASKGNKAKRTVLSKIKPEHYAYYKLHDAYKSLSQTTSDRGAKSLRKKHDSRISINPNFIIDKAAKYILSETADWKKKTVALIVFTGRRPTEILKTWTARKATSNSILFDGQLKTRGRSAHEDVTPYYVPVLNHQKVSINDIKDAINAVQIEMKRQQVTFVDVVGSPVKSTVISNDYGKDDIQHNRGVKEFTNRKINRELVKIFGNIGITCKTLRAAYSELAYRQNGDSVTSKSAYTAKILGYASSGFGAALNYEQVDISDDVERAHNPNIKKARADKKEKHELLSLLKSHTDTVAAYRRAPSLLELHKTLIRMTETGELSIDSMSYGKLRKIPVNDRFINAKTIRDVYLPMIGIK